MVMSTPDAGADCPDVSMLLRMFSTLVAVREVQPSQVLRKQSGVGVPVQVSKKLAGKSVRLIHDFHASLKICPEERFIAEPFLGGNFTKLLQFLHVKVQFVGLPVMICGKL